MACSRSIAASLIPTLPDVGHDQHQRARVRRESILGGLLLAHGLADGRGAGTLSDRVVQPAKGDGVIPPLRSSHWSRVATSMVAFSRSGRVLASVIALSASSRCLSAVGHCPATCRRRIDDGLVVRGEEARRPVALSAPIVRRVQAASMASRRREPADIGRVTVRRLWGELVGGRSRADDRDLRQSVADTLGPGVDVSHELRARRRHGVDPRRRRCSAATRG